MNWMGDIYEESSGDYRIRTTYSHKGAFSTLYYCGRAIAYASDIDDAKAKAEEHADRNGVEVE